MSEKRGYHHGNLRPALIQAALRELAVSGLEGMSLRGVARRAGVSAPAVYRHFADKEALLGAVAVACNEQLSMILAQAAMQAMGLDPLEQFRATGIAYLQFAVAHPDEFRAMSMPGVIAHVPAAQREQMEAWEKMERASLRAAQAAGHLSDIPVEIILMTAQATIHGLAHMILEGHLGEVDAARATQLAIDATAALGAGFAPRTEPYVDPRRPKP